MSSLHKIYYSHLELKMKKENDIFSFMCLDIFYKFNYLINKKLIYLIDINGILIFCKEMKENYIKKINS